MERSDRLWGIYPHFYSDYGSDGVSAVMSSMYQSVTVSLKENLKIVALSFVTSAVSQKILGRQIRFVSTILCNN